MKRRSLFPAAIVALVVLTSVAYASLRRFGPSAPAKATMQGELSSGLLEQRADSLYAAGAFQDARDLWEAYVATTPDSAAIARGLTWMGLASFRLGDHATARKDGERALALKERLKLRDQLADSYNALGILAWREGRLADAASLLTRSLEAARATGNERGVARAAGNMGLVLTDLGDFVGARDGFTALRDAGRALAEPRLEGNGYNNLGMLAVKIGDALGALDALTHARRLYASIDYAFGEQHVLGQLATAYALAGDSRAAFAAADSALRLARVQGLREEEASNLQLLAEQYRAAGDFRSALRHLADAIRLADELGLEDEGGTMRRTQAKLWFALGDSTAAIRLAEEALQRHRRIGARFEEVHDRILLAELADALADRVTADAHLRDASILAGSMSSDLAQVRVALARAESAERRSDPGLALRALKQTDTSLARVGREERWRTHAVRARSHARLGQLDAARLAGTAAVAELERSRASLPSGALKTSYTAMVSHVYASQVVTLLRLGDVGEAFRVADAARGRMLVEHLATARSQARLSSEAAELLQGELLLQRIDALIALLDEVRAASPERSSESVRERSQTVERLLASTRTEYEALTARSSGAVDQRTTGLRLGMTPVSPQLVRQALAPREMLLQYLVMPDSLLVFAVGSETVSSIVVPRRAAVLESRIRVARELISQRAPDAGEAHEVLGALWMDLVEPVARRGLLRDVSSLIIVPDGPLAYLPFAALRDPGADEYLAERRSVQMIASAAALIAIRQRESAEVRDGSSRISVLAPFPRELPSSHQEARSVRRTLPAVTLLVGRRATERGLRHALRSSAIVHVATHGRLNARNPLFSRLELTKGREGDRTDDGRLEVSEMLGMEVRSDLVFLSGCETALGRAWATEFERTEDYSTLALAFLYAGTRNVIATLWRVDDRGAAALAERFYFHLRRHRPVDALAAAQRDLIRGSELAAPYYWAGFQLSGAGR